MAEVSGRAAGQLAAFDGEGTVSAAPDVPRMDDDAGPAPGGAMAGDAPAEGAAMELPADAGARLTTATEPPEATVAGAGPATAGIAPAGPTPVAETPGAAGAGGLVPGAYLPPSAVHRPERSAPPPQMPLAASPTVGAPPPTTAAAWVPIAAPPPAPPPAPVPAGRASLFADLPFDAPDTMAEWLVAVGSGVSAISFLLPWISGTVSYDTSWGLATASRLPILGLLVVTAVLGILPNRVAGWVRSGVLGLIGGSLFLGVLWPIVTGDYGDAAFGAVIGAAAAIVLIVGGIVGVAPRSGPSTPD
jgi:hypothetical protein